MSYYLQWPPSNGWVSTPDWYPSSPDNWSFEVDIRTPSTVSGDKTVIGQENSTTARCWKLFINNGNIGIIHNSNWSGGGFVVTPVSASTRYLVRGEFDGDEIRLYLDNVLAASASGRNLSVVAAKSHLSFIGRSGSSGASVITDLALYRARFWDDSTQSLLAIDYNKQALSGSNDIILPDAVSGNDGTLINFPTDNSQWVFFDDGGGSSVALDGAATLPSLAVAGNASATLPQPQLSASINLTQLSATGSASVTLPNPKLSASVLFGQLTASGVASATLPNPQLSGAITFNAATVTGSVSASLPQPTLQGAITFPTVSANGNASATLPGFSLSASVTLPSITATGAAQATLPQPNLSASVSMPALSSVGAAETTEPSFSLSASVTLPALTASGSMAATLPQPSISGNITLPRIRATGYIVGGEVVITVTAQTNVTEPTLSTNVNEPTLSTNITEKTLSTNITEQ